jgi:hypothetical protein
MRECAATISASGPGSLALPAGTQAATTAIPKRCDQALNPAAFVVLDSLRIIAGATLRV